MVKIIFQKRVILVLYSFAFQLYLPDKKKYNTNIYSCTFFFVEKSGILINHNSNIKWLDWQQLFMHKIIAHQKKSQKKRKSI